MADSALIDDLERQFADNPRRVFARLANEYRKAGDAERAIEICHSQVPQQPGYISGHIVLGQALYDLGRYDEARAAFETALGLDPENLIALRQLGDIARETGDVESARSWYERLLEVDPQNEEIAEQLGALGESATPPASTTPADSGAAPAAPVSWGDIHPDAAPAGAADQEGELAGESQVEPAIPDIAMLEETTLEETTIDVQEAFPVAPLPDVSPDGPDASDAAAVAPQVVEGLDHGIPAAEAGDAEESPDAPVTPLPGFEPTVLDPLSESEAAPGLEFLERTPEVAIDTAALSVEGDAPPAPSDVDEAEAAPAAALEVEQAESPAAATPAGVATNHAGAGDAFVTETMADLYLQQGLSAQALDVYRALARQHPGETRFTDRIAELERAVAEVEARGEVAVPAESDPEWMHQSRPARTGPTIRAFLTGIATRRARSGTDGEPPDGAADDDGADDPPSGPPPEPPVDPVTPQAQSPMDAASASPDTADALFPGWAVAREDEEAASALAGGYADDRDTADGREGVPAHRAADEPSLASVFRHEAGGESGESRERNVSFDEFFAGETAEDGMAPVSANEDAEADARSAADLELFHAWLEGLKK